MTGTRSGTGIGCNDLLGGDCTAVLPSKSDGIYDSIDLNGWTLASEKHPPQHSYIAIGYRAPHIPEIWFGFGRRDGDRYWLGPRGLDPHYQSLAAIDVLIWREVDFPFCFHSTEQRGTNNYLQWQYILGDEPPPNANSSAESTE